MAKRGQRQVHHARSKSRLLGVKLERAKSMARRSTQIAAELLIITTDTLRVAGIAATVNHAPHDMVDAANVLRSLCEQIGADLEEIERSLMVTTSGASSASNGPPDPAP